MCYPDLGFYLLDPPLAHPTPKVYTLIHFSRAHFWNCALRLAILNFSLRFRNLSRTYCKTQATIKIESRKRYTSHTVSTQSCFSAFDVEKRLRLEHVRKVCARCALLLRFHNVSWCETVLGPSDYFAPIIQKYTKYIKNKNIQNITITIF